MTVRADPAKVERVRAKFGVTRANFDPASPVRRRP